MTSRPQLSVDLDLRVSDLSGDGHLGNVEVLRLVDEARALALGFGPQGESRHEGVLAPLLDRVTYVVGQHIVEYREEVWFRGQRLRVDVWIPYLGRTSMLVASAVHDEGDPEPAALVESSLVLLDATTRRPWPIDDDARALLAPFAGPRPDLRPRLPLD